MAYLEEEEIEEKPDGARSLSSLTASLGRQPKPETCVECGKPRSFGSGQRCRACYLARAEAKRDEPSKQQESPVKADPRQGPAYKSLDLVEVEEVMATEETIAKGAAKLGLTTSQLNQRRYRDEPVNKAVERGRERYYLNAPEIDLDADADDPDPQESGKNITKPITSNGTKPATESQQPEQAQVVAQDKSADTNMSVADFSPSNEEPKEAVAETREIMLEIYQVEQILSQPHARKKMQPAWSPDFESDNPEDTRGLTMCYLIGMLHHNMEPHEKEAVWTLVQYLKRIEAYVEER